MPSEDEVDDSHRPPTTDFRCLLKEVGGHFILTWCFSVSHSVYEKVEFPKCGDWVSQPFLSANRSVGENIRPFQERSIPYSTLVGTEVLGVVSITFYMGAEVVYTPVRAGISPHRGCGLLPGHRDRSESCVSLRTCGKGVICVSLEEGFCCCNEIAFTPWARRWDKRGLLELWAPLKRDEVAQSSRPAMQVSVSVLTAMPSESTTSVYFSPVFIICSWRLGRTFCVFILSAGEVSLSLHAHQKLIGHSQYTSLMAVALLYLLRTLRNPLTVPTRAVTSISHWIVSFCERYWLAGVWCLCYVRWRTLFLINYFGIELVLCDLYLTRFDLTKDFLFDTFFIAVFDK